MRHRTTRASLIAAGLLATALLAGCGSSGDTNDTKGSGNATSEGVAKPAHGADATAAYRTIHAAVPSTTVTAVVTEANDGNHLMGRPHQYTSAIKFADSRIKPADVDGTDKDDVSRGGGIEVFANHRDAQARADYIQAVTKDLPALSEYDFVHGNTVLRISYLLTPTQAKEYDQAGDKL